MHGAVCQTCAWHRKARRNQENKRKVDAAWHHHAVIQRKGPSTQSSDGESYAKSLKGGEAYHAGAIVIKLLSRGNDQLHENDAVTIFVMKRKNVYSVDVTELLWKDSNEQQLRPVSACIVRFTSCCHQAHLATHRRISCEMNLL
jgi:hypothetical protein